MNKWKYSCKELLYVFLYSEIGMFVRNYCLRNWNALHKFIETWWVIFYGI